MDFVLSDEQKFFVQLALSGRNVLVDACIGSGKTRSIQALCSLYTGKRILYLTYNKLLKADAQARITGGNVRVTNYHGFAYGELLKAGVRCGVSDLVRTYLSVKPPCPGIDVLILDEYQDLEGDLADLLLWVSQCNPGMQKVAVGDMAQKIYDKTRLDAMAFIRDFLGAHYQVEFTQCFRVGAGWARGLSSAWKKEIVGVNPDFTVRQMTEDQAVSYMAGKEPGNLLCLGANGGCRDRILNELEGRYPERFNKFTVWAKVREGGATQPQAGAAVFTTYDGCKGMERDICVVCDFDKNYWQVRCGQPGARYEILRNVFLVAVSRGKREVVFVKGKAEALSFADLMDESMGDKREAPRDCALEELFDFKYAEDVDACACLLAVTEEKAAGEEIPAPGSDGLIDLSPCLSVFAKASYFENYRMELRIALAQENHPEMPRMVMDGWGTDAKVLYLTALTTGQARYLYQVQAPFVPRESGEAIHKRLSGFFPQDLPAQARTGLSIGPAAGGFLASGYPDASDADSAWRILFVPEITQVHLLTAACFALCMGKRFGKVLNVRTGQVLCAEVKDPAAFLPAVAKAATKGAHRTARIPGQKPDLPGKRAGRPGKGAGAAAAQVGKQPRRMGKNPSALVPVAGGKKRKVRKGDFVQVEIRGRMQNLSGRVTGYGDRFLILRTAAGERRCLFSDIVDLKVLVSV